MIEDDQSVFPRQDIELMPQDRRLSPTPSYRLPNSLPVFDFEEALSPERENINSPNDFAQSTGSINEPLMEAKPGPQSLRSSSFTSNGQHSKAIHVHCQRRTIIMAGLVINGTGIALANHFFNRNPQPAILDWNIGVDQKNHCRGRLLVQRIIDSSCCNDISRSPLE